jgi:hypothetical protein
VNVISEYETYDGSFEDTEAEISNRNGEQSDAGETE